ncbi:MAG: hypothetical protein Q8R28_19020 [Dehalococcoidia bacterium]|nr:hypothetical protein [Dehalococcoidia bacterium]
MSMDLVTNVRHPAHETVVQLIKELTQPYSAPAIGALIRAGTVPDSFVPLALAYVDKHAELMTLSDVQFRLAAMDARPEIGELFDSPAGRQWTEKVALRIAASLPGHWLRSLFGGKP